MSTRLVAALCLIAGSVHAQRSLESVTECDASSPTCMVYTVYENAQDCGGATGPLVTMSIEADGLCNALPKVGNGTTTFAQAGCSSTGDVVLNFCTSDCSSCLLAHEGPSGNSAECIGHANMPEQASTVDFDCSEYGGAIVAPGIVNSGPDPEPSDACESADVDCLTLRHFGTSEECLAQDGQEGTNIKADGMCNPDPFNDGGYMMIAGCSEEGNVVVRSACGPDCSACGLTIEWEDVCMQADGTNVFGRVDNFDCATYPGQPVPTDNGGGDEPDAQACDPSDAACMQINLYRNEADCAKEDSLPGATLAIVADGTCTVDPSGEDMYMRAGCTAEGRTMVMAMCDDTCMRGSCQFVANWSEDACVLVAMGGDNVTVAVSDFTCEGYSGVPMPSEPSLGDDDDDDEPGLDDLPDECDSVASCVEELSGDLGALIQDTSAPAAVRCQGQQEFVKTFSGCISEECVAALTVDTACDMVESLFDTLTTFLSANLTSYECTMPECTLGDQGPGADNDDEDEDIPGNNSTAGDDDGEEDEEDLSDSESGASTVSLTTAAVVFSVAALTRF